MVSAVEGVSVIIKAVSSDRDATTRGRLFYRQIGEREYHTQPMIASVGEFTGMIPAQDVAGIGIEYYIMLYLTDGTAITSPEQDAMLSPHVIIIIPSNQKWLEILTPEADSLVDDKKPQIAVAFNADLAINPERIKVKLDGIDITKECEITQDFVLYVPSDEFRTGVHVVTVSNLDFPEMITSWQFVIVAGEGLIQDISGSASLSWQWSHDGADSDYALHTPGSSFGYSAQVAGQAIGKTFDAWVNRTAFYRSKSTDFGFGLYSDNLRIGIGDVFPSISRLTLDGMPARGGEIDVKPAEMMSIYLVGAESRLFTDLDDEFTAGLLNSRFGGIQVTLRPIKNRLKVGALYIHARNHAESDPDIPFSIDKHNNIFSLNTQLELPASFNLYGEWAHSDHLTRYDGEFASESLKDSGINISVDKRIRSLMLEVFYLNIGKDFLSEVNPFVEDGKKGVGTSVRYSYGSKFSSRMEYGRYHKESETNTEMRANVSLSFSKLPSFYAVYYQQRFPYAKYDARGATLGSSYKFWMLNLSANGSVSNVNLWTNDIESRSVSGSVNMEYKLRAGTDLKASYFQFTGHRSGELSREQKQAYFGVRHYVRQKHLISADLKAVEFNDKSNSENNYFEKLILLKYGYSF